MTVGIRSQDDYEAVLARIRALRRSPATFLETSELKQLLGAADEWNRKSGGEAAGELDDVAGLSVQTSSIFTLGMARRFPQTDWVASLAALLGKNRDYVEWHLQHDVMPPEDVVAAARRLIDGERPPGDDAAERDLDGSAPVSESAPSLAMRPTELSDGERKTSRLQSLLNVFLSGTAVALTTSAALGGAWPPRRAVGRTTCELHQPLVSGQCSWACAAARRAAHAPRLRDPSWRFAVLGLRL